MNSTTVHHEHFLIRRTSQPSCLIHEFFDAPDAQIPLATVTARVGWPDSRRFSVDVTYGSGTYLGNEAAPMAEILAAVFARVATLVPELERAGPANVTVAWQAVVEREERYQAEVAAGRVRVLTPPTNEG